MAQAKVCRRARFFKERGKCFIKYIPTENAWVPRVAEAANEHGIALKTIYIEDEKSAQNMPAPVVNYALFRDGEFLTHAVQSDIKFLSFAGV